MSSTIDVSVTITDPDEPIEVEVVSGIPGAQGPAGGGGGGPIAAQSIVANPTGAVAVPSSFTVAEQTLVGRITGGNVDDLSAAQVRTLLGVADLTDYLGLATPLTIAADPNKPGFIDPAGAVNEAGWFAREYFFNGGVGSGLSDYWGITDISTPYINLNLIGAGGAPAATASFYMPNNFNSGDCYILLSNTLDATGAFVAVQAASGQTGALFSAQSNAGVGVWKVMPSGVVDVLEQGSDPAAAAANRVLLYPKNVGGVSRWFLRDDTAVKQLAVTTDISDAVTTHAGATDPHGDRAFATSAVGTHEADTTSVHGITDTSALALTANVILKALIDAKGDLIAGTAADTPGILTVGANDTILMADSGQATGLKWVASATPSTQAFGDAAAVGTADTFTRGDHKHAMPSAADVLTAVKTVDGTGSGLDADLLDGNEAAAFLKLVAGGSAVEDIGAIESNVNTVAATGSTETLDTSVYAVHDTTMDQNCTFTFSNPAPSGKNSTFMHIIRGAFTPTLPASVKWSGGAAPTYTTPSVYVFTTVDAGTNWLGQQVGKAFA